MHCFPIQGKYDLHFISYVYRQFFNIHIYSFFISHIFSRNDIFVVPISLEFSSNTEPGHLKEDKRQNKKDKKQGKQDKEDSEQGQEQLSIVFGNLVLYTDGRYSMVIVWKCTL